MSTYFQHSDMSMHLNRLYVTQWLYIAHQPYQANDSLTLSSINYHCMWTFNSSFSFKCCKNILAKRLNFKQQQLVGMIAIKESHLFRKKVDRGF